MVSCRFSTMQATERIKWMFRDFVSTCISVYSNTFPVLTATTLWNMLQILHRSIRFLLRKDENTHTYTHISIYVCRFACLCLCLCVSSYLSQCVRIIILRFVLCKEHLFCRLKPTVCWSEFDRSNTYKSFPLRMRII